MKYATSLQDKVELVRKRFSGLVGQRITGYELVQLWVESEEEWVSWNDLPVVLSFESGACLSIWWYKFDELAIEEGRVLPFSLSGCTVRWVSEGTAALDKAVDQVVESVALANDEMSIERVVEIWIHLCLRLQDGKVLDIYNALDENGFAFVSDQIRSCNGEIPLRVKECV